MTTLPDRIRAAALGPTPTHDTGAMSSWVGGSDMHKICKFAVTKINGFDFRHDGNNTTRRMFLLFVACALENP